MTILDPRLWLGIVLMVLASYGGSSIGPIRAYIAERLAASLAAQKRMTDAVEAARNEEQRRTAEQTRIAKDAKDQRDIAEAAARRADASAVSLRARVDQLLAAARTRDSNSIGGSSTEPDALGVLADVLGRVDERAGILAKAADAAHIAGLACERSYDALNKSDGI